MMTSSKVKKVAKGYFVKLYRNKRNVGNAFVKTKKEAVRMARRATKYYHKHY